MISQDELVKTIRSIVNVFEDVTIADSFDILAGVMITIAKNMDNNGMTEQQCLAMLFRYTIKSLNECEKYPWDRTKD